MKYEGIKRCYDRTCLPYVEVAGSSRRCAWFSALFVKLLVIGDLK